MRAPSGIDGVLVREGERVMRLCNACRYCEGYCAVFPALERRLVFSEADLCYLANLCHDCGECYYACQYAPPQEFALNFPRTLAEIRLATYRKYAWPRGLGGLFRRSGLATSIASAAGVVLFLVLLAAFRAPFQAHADAQGSFHAVMGHGEMVAVFGALAAGAVLVLAKGFAAFWRDTGGNPGETLDARALCQGLADALRLRYLDGGGQGCSYPGEVSSHARRRFHHLTFYGFLLCLAATSLAAVYHYVLGRHAPYPLLSGPVVLGTAGGVGLLVGPAGLLWLKAVRDPALADRGQTGLDVSFLVLLSLTSLTGLLLLGLRETPAMGVLLAVHLGLVLGVFVTSPYGKFVHGVYRFGALVRNAIEQRTKPRFGSE